MATKRQKTEVGVFLVGVLVILAAVVVTLTGVNRKRLDRYYVEFEETIAGLTEGSRVSYRGVTVGKVLDLRVTAENRVGVTLGIDPTKVTVRQGVKARYSLLSLFGPYVVDLSGGTDRDAPVLEPGAFIPVRPSVMADLEETLADSVPLALQRLTRLVERLDTVFSRIKPDDLPGLFRRAEDLFASADKVVEGLQARTAEIAASLDKAIRAAQADVEKALGKAGGAAMRLQQATDAAAARAEKLLDTVQATLDENRKPLGDALKRFDATLTQVQRQLDGLDLAATTKSIREAADKLGKGADSVGSSVKTLAVARDDVRRSLTSVERDLTRVLDDLDQALRAARDLLDTLERDPSAILRGRRGGP
ncbi:MAG TPA: MlaD family protein [Planctomycetota bacterium]|nr:MlaD family protein [Planctomycetota bacterium]